MNGSQCAAISIVALAAALSAAPARAALTFDQPYVRGGSFGIPIATRLQLRGHLPELGDKPSLRLFQTVAAYDGYRKSLGDANIFPPVSSLFMSFDREILVLYSPGNDVGGRCLKIAPTTYLDANLTLGLGWEVGSCGAPISAHNPFILASMSRVRVDGSAWMQPGEKVCADLPPADPDSFACAAVVGAGASPVPTSSPVATTAATIPTPSPLTTSPPSAAVSAAPTQTTITLTSPTVTAAPVALATTQPVAESDGGPNGLLVLVLIGFGFLVGVALIASRRPTDRP